MVIAFDIGNTETVIGLFHHDELLDHWRITTRPEQTADEFGLLVRALLRESGFEPDDIEAAAIGSVVPRMTAACATMCEAHLGARTLVVDATLSLPIRLDVDEPRSVGADRIVNTLAAHQLFRKDTLVVDLGTATTYDCISRDGIFRGGAIAPGVRTGAESLVRRTARLPDVDLTRPPTVIGRRTETAMRAGIFYSAVDAIDGMVQRILKEWQRPDALVVATGGLAEALAPHCRSIARTEPFITLIGLNLALRHVQGRRRR
jgi:type III pantothenate kinase